jgi:hypothetical protein
MNFPASQANRELNTLPFDPELTPGARNAVNVCLRIKSSEKVTVITDEATKEIAASIVHELEILGASYRAWILEELASRPLTDLPRGVEAFEWSPDGTSLAVLSSSMGPDRASDARARRKAPEKYGIELPDRQLACAPVNSPEGQKYIAAMRAAANFAWCNRQLLMHQAREVFAGLGAKPLVAEIDRFLQRVPAQG